MAAFKDKKNGTWYVQFRYVDWKGERQQSLVKKKDLRYSSVGKNDDILR